MNEIESANKAKTLKDKELQDRITRKDKELAELQEQMEIERQFRIEVNDEHEVDDRRERIIALEEQLRRLRDEDRAETAASELTSSNNELENPPHDDEYDDLDDIDMLNVVDQFDAPDTPSLDGRFSEPPHALSSPLREQQHASIYKRLPTGMTDAKYEAEILAITLDLEAAQESKYNFLQRWRNEFPHSRAQPLSPSKDSSGVDKSLDEFMTQLYTALNATTDRADSAEQALETLKHQVHELGFPGEGVENILEEINHQFHHARLELERAVPGETPAGFENAKVLNALVDRIRAMAYQVRASEQALEAEKNTHSALRGQFDKTLLKMEAARKNLSSLERQLDTATDDNMQARMQVQRLERDGEEKEQNLEKLKVALDKYRDEVKGLEALITKMDEEGNARYHVQLNEAIADVQCKADAETKGRRAAEASAVERGERVKELEERLQATQAYAEEARGQILALMQEKEDITQNIQKGAKDNQNKDRQMGVLNTQLSNLTTALSDANEEVETLRAARAALEKRVEEEREKGSEAVQNMQTAFMRTLAQAGDIKNSYLRGAKIRQANGEIADEVDEMAGVEGQEPMTPVSVVRFVDVEVGRGKNRRKYDSGVGIEDVDEDEEAEIEGVNS